MITGVTVLEEISVMTIGNINIIIMLALMFALSFVVSFINYKMVKSRNKIVRGLSHVEFVLSLFISCIILLWVPSLMMTPTGKFKYEVSLDEGVDMTELKNKYEILEVIDGGTSFIIEEKDGE